MLKPVQTTGHGYRHAKSRTIWPSETDSGTPRRLIAEQHPWEFLPWRLFNRGSTTPREKRADGFPGGLALWVGQDRDQDRRGLLKICDSDVLFHAMRAHHPETEVCGLDPGTHEDVRVASASG